MKKRGFTRFAAVALTGALLLAPAAQALTTEEARALLTTYYVDPIPAEVLEQSTVEDLLHALNDPYTNYLTAEDYATFSGSMADAEMVGIGVVFANTESGMLLSGVVPGSPAEKAGLQAGDLITHVDGTSVLGLKNSAIAALVGGKEGSTLALTYLRKGNMKTVRATRARIYVPTMTTVLLDGHIGYLNCRSFGGDTLRHFTDGITANSGAADRWIVDLTANSGGTLNGVIEPLGLFLDDKELAHFRDADGYYTNFESTQAARTMQPMIVATDGGTASAAELFTAAIRDQKAGIVVGGRTFGKGVAQVVFNKDNMPLVFPDGDAMTVTNARFFAPGGATNDTVGVIPHLMVPDEYAADVAYLLSASEPKADNKNWMRLDLTWRWYVDLDTAKSDRYKAAFTALLQAIPPDARLMAGSGEGRWQRITPAELAKASGLRYQSRAFADSADSCYGEKMDVLATYELLPRDADNKFLPNEVLTRGDLCVMLATALQCPAFAGDTLFSDVAMDAPYGQAVNALADMGLVSGTSEGIFQPDAAVDHQQLMVIMARVAKYLNTDYYEAARKMPTNATALAGLIPFNSWARPSVWLLSADQAVGDRTDSLLWDTVEHIQPGAASTRGEGAALLYNVLSDTGVLPERIPQVKN